MTYDLVVVGGGAAGFFTAIRCAEINKHLKICILEKSAEVLGKVRISGGGRCNVTHACFEPAAMTQYYPRGHKELRGPFHRFLCGDMMQWLEEHDVPTTIEKDQRVFPSSNTSSSIVNCFMDLCHSLNVKIIRKSGVTSIKKEHKLWHIRHGHQHLEATQLLLATGSSPAMWKLIGQLGHTIVPPVPSLFTFNIQDPLIQNLQGLTAPKAIVSIKGLKFHESGPLLITHWGLSGPAILKLSAWAARELHQQDYQFSMMVNWTGEAHNNIANQLAHSRRALAKRNIGRHALFGLPKRLWVRITDKAGISSLNYAELGAAQQQQLVDLLTNTRLQVSGKSTFKDEFVTCGGVDTKEVNFKTMESKLHAGLYFAGEVLNIDAVTGGFNFQAAWTEGYIAAEAITTRCESGPVT